MLPVGILGIMTIYEKAAIEFRLDAWAFEDRNCHESAANAREMAQWCDKQAFKQNSETTKVGRKK